jgi:hypothetical protein
MTTIQKRGPLLSIRPRKKKDKKRRKQKRKNRTGYRYGIRIKAE